MKIRPYVTFSWALSIHSIKAVLLTFTEKPPVIAGIYRVKRPSEDETFDNHAIKKNRQLLWHGTHSAHMIGILTDGLKVDAKNVRRIGRSLGDVRI